MVKPTHAIVDSEGNVLEYIFPFADGSIPAGAMALPDAILDNAKEAKWEVVKAKRLKVEHGGAATLSGRMDSDPESQRKINGLVTMAMLALQSGQSFSQDFTLADNTVVTLDAAAMIAAGVAVGQHVSNTHAVSRQVRSLIDAALRLEDLDVIDIDAASWPI